MIVVNMLILAASIMAAVGIFCRLNKLSWKEHKISVIVFNVGLLGAILSAGEHAWIDAVDLQDISILIASMCWIAISYKSWQERPPEYVRKEPNESSRP